MSHGPPRFDALRAMERGLGLERESEYEDLYGGVYGDYIMRVLRIDPPTPPEVPVIFTRSKAFMKVVGRFSGILQLFCVS